MKVTKSLLKTLINEELNNIISEQADGQRSTVGQTRAPNMGQRSGTQTQSMRRDADKVKTDKAETIYSMALKYMKLSCAKSGKCKPGEEERSAEELADSLDDQFGGNKIKAANQIRKMMQNVGGGLEYANKAARVTTRKGRSTRSSGSNTVKLLQQALIDVGISVGRTGADGKMGRNTRAGMKAMAKRIAKLPKGKNVAAKLSKNPARMLKFIQDNFPDVKGTTTAGKVQKVATAAGPSIDPDLQQAVYKGYEDYLKMGKSAGADSLEKIKASDEANKLVTRMVAFAEKNPNDIRNEPNVIRQRIKNIMLKKYGMPV